MRVEFLKMKIISYHDYSEADVNSDHEFVFRICENKYYIMSKILNKKFFLHGNH